MFKKLLFVLFISMLIFINCDYKVKKCTYEVYQKGELLPINYVDYRYRLGDKCTDFTKDGNVYKLLEVKMIDYGTINH